MSKYKSMESAPRDGTQIIVKMSDGFERIVTYRNLDVLKKSEDFRLSKNDSQNYWADDDEFNIGLDEPLGWRKYTKRDRS